MVGKHLRGRVTIAIVLLFSVISEIKAETLSVKKDKGTGYWVATAKSDLLTEEILKKIANDSNNIVLNIPYNNDDKVFGYNAIVRKLKLYNPEISIYMYIWATRWRGNGRIIEDVLKGYDGLGEMLVRDNKGVPYRTKKGFYFGDVSNSKYRRWVIERVSRWVDITNSDGVAIDTMFRNPRGVISTVCKIKEKCLKYNSGVEEMLVELKEAMPEKKIIINGIFNHNDKFLKSQLQLLPFSDGFAIEYFGLIPRKESNSLKIFNDNRTFYDDILPYLETINKNPDKFFMVFGRGKWNKEDDSNWQKYLYANYLLVKGKNTNYKYHASFQVPRHAGNTGGLYSKQYDYKLGQSVSRYSEKMGIYYRLYTNGVVIVAPHLKKIEQYRIDFADELEFLYKRTGLRGVDLISGEAKIIYYRKLN